jgi:hypothetical protein
VKATTQLARPNYACLRQFGLGEIPVVTTSDAAIGSERRTRFNWCCDV